MELIADDFWQLAGWPRDMFNVAARGAEIAHPGTHGVVGQVPALGNGRAGEVFDEKGTQGRVTAVQGLGGLAEELVAE